MFDPELNYFRGSTFFASFEGTRRKFPNGFAVISVTLVDYL